jgi:hypothetical protein
MKFGCEIIDDTFDCGQTAVARAQHYADYYQKLAFVAFNRKDSKYYVCWDLEEEDLRTLSCRIVRDYNPLPIPPRKQKTSFEVRQLELF